MSVVAKNWLRGLLGILGALELLMAVSAAPPGRQTTVSLLVAASLPFAILTWWTIVTPLLTVIAFVIGVATTRISRIARGDAGAAPPLDVHSVR